jgi:hypothetical protein
MMVFRPNRFETFRISTTGVGSALDTLSPGVNPEPTPAVNPESPPTVILSEAKNLFVRDSNRSSRQMPK